MGGESPDSWIIYEISGELKGILVGDLLFSIGTDLPSPKQVFRVLPTREGILLKVRLGLKAKLEEREEARLD